MLFIDVPYDGANLDFEKMQAPMLRSDLNVHFAGLLSLEPTANSIELATVHGFRIFVDGTREKDNLKTPAFFPAWLVPRARGKQEATLEFKTTVTTSVFAGVCLCTLLCIVWCLVLSSLTSATFLCWRRPRGRASRTS